VATARYEEGRLHLQAGGGGRPRRPFEVDLSGRETLVLLASDAGDRIRGDPLVLGRPLFR
jgi:hypothetical protein